MLNQRLQLDVLFLNIVVTVQSVSFVPHLTSQLASLAEKLAIVLPPSNKPIDARIKLVPRIIGSNESDVAPRTPVAHQSRS